MAITLPLVPTPDDLSKLESDHSRKYTPHLLDPADPIRQRIVIERAIVRRAVSDLIAAGCWVRVFYGPEEGWGCQRTDNVDVVMEAVGACDEEVLYVFPSSSGARQGFIHFVYGNDGWDVIADNSTRIEYLLAGATELSDAICEASYLGDEA
jgi:hypothetical protein